MMQVFNVKGKAVLKSVPLPQITSCEVLVQTSYSAISVGTETKSLAPSSVGLIQKAFKRKDLIALAVKKAKTEGILKTYSFAKSMMSSWHPLGYSCSGVVVKVGSQVTSVRVGDKVACAGLGHASHAHYVAVPKTMISKVSSGVSMRDASFSTLGAISIHALHRAEASFGQVVVIYGMGLIGNITARVALAAGCQVIGVDTNKLNLDRSSVHLALDLSAHSAEQIESKVLAFTKGRGVDSVIVTAKSDESGILNSALRMCRKKGKVVIVGHVGLDIDRAPFYEKEVDVLISRSYGPGRHEKSYEEKGVDLPLEYARWTIERNMEEFLRLLAEKKIVLEGLVDLEVEFAQAEKAYESLQSGASLSPLSVVLKYSEIGLKEKGSVVIVPKVKPKDTYGVAIIGGGNFAQDVHIPELMRRKEFFVKTILTKQGHTAAKIARYYGIPEVASSYEDILADSDIDVIVIVTPHSTHRDYVVAAIKAGKHVFCEKPLALTREQCQDIYSALVANPVVFTVGFNRTFSPMVHEVEKVFHGEVGLGASGVGSGVSHFSNPLNIHYRMQSVVNAQKGWLYDPEVGGGRIIGEFCHIYDFLSYITRDTVVELKVFGVGGNCNTENSVDGNFQLVPRVCAENNLGMLVRFEHGSVATITYSEDGSKDLEKERIEIIGSGHVAVISDFVSLEVDGKKRSGKLQKGFREHYDEFLKALRGEKHRLISIDCALRVMELCFVTLEQVRGVEMSELDKPSEVKRSSRRDPSKPVLNKPKVEAKKTSSKV